MSNRKPSAWKFEIHVTREPPQPIVPNGPNAIPPPSEISNLSNELFVELILYGNERLLPDANKRLIEATLKSTHANATKRS